MKHILFLGLAALAYTGVFAQSEKYVAAMEARVQALDTTRSPEAMAELANAFERIAAAEKTQWLPYYYAALATINRGFMMNGNQMGGNAGKTDPIADKAELLIQKAEALSQDNSEIYVVKKMIATLRMMGDPATRFMQYGPEGAQALETAQKLNPENPRVYLLMAQDKLFTPEQFGGSREEAIKLFTVALQKYEAQKPENTISPAWGKTTTQYFLGQAKK